MNSLPSFPCLHSHFLFFLLDGHTSQPLLQQRRSAPALDLSLLYPFCRPLTPGFCVAHPFIAFKPLLQRFRTKKAKPSHTILNRIPINLTFRLSSPDLLHIYSLFIFLCGLSRIVWCIPLRIGCAWYLAGTLIRLCLWTHWQESLQILVFFPPVYFI